MKKSKKILIGSLTLIFLSTVSLSAFFIGYQKDKNDLLFQKIQQLEKRLTATEDGNEPQLLQKTYVEESAIIDTVKKVRPAVVSIIETKKLPIYRRHSNPFLSDPFFREFFIPGLDPREFEENQEDTEEESRRVQTGAGSGFIYSEDGFVMTNRHVVADEKAEYTVVLYDGTEFPAVVIARDTFNDVAVVKIQPESDIDLPELQSLVFGDSENIQVGQRIVAIGNALAEFQNTVTTGIISGVERDIMASNGMRGRREQLQGLLQTDAAINPGNSGGPLVNLAGEIVGMNTAIASGADGIGFAIPANDLKSIADSVEKHGKIIRPFLGVQYVMLTEAIATELDLEISEGALLIGNTNNGMPGFAIVKDSAADKAGLQESDVIVAIDGEQITPKNDLRRIISRKEVGQQIELQVWRDGKEEKFAIELQSME